MTEGVRLVVGIVGAGNMGSALMRGWLRGAAPAGAGAADGSAPAGPAETGSAPEAAPAPGVDLVVWDKVEEAVRQWRGVEGVSVAGSLEGLTAGAAVVFVVVKPKDADEVLRAVGGAMGPGGVVVSAMAGLPLSWMRSRLGAGPALVRIMPNLGVASGNGAVAVVAEAGTPPETMEAVLALLRPLGLVEVVAEDLFDVVTAVSGSGPGFLALAVEGLEDGAVAAGLTRQAARRLVRQAALFAARQSPDPDDPSAEPQQRGSLGDPAVQAALKVLEEREVREAFRQAVEAAARRSRQMRQS